MKNVFALFVVASVFSNLASAQMRERPRHECQRVCLSVDPTPQKARFEKKLIEIRKMKDHESDLRKLNELAEEEKSLIEKHQDSVDNMCHKICDQNPEQ